MDRRVAGTEPAGVVKRVLPRPLWVALALTLSACHGSAPAQSASATSGKRYTVRAEVVALPPRAGGDLVLRHEAIPGFTDASGAVVGMGSMVMPFPVSTQVSLAGVSPGDKVEFVFSIDWAQGRYLIESLRKLPRETRLDLAGRSDTEPIRRTADGARR